MKKTILFLLTVVLSCSAIAQLTFDMDTARLTLEPNVPHKAIINVSNNSGKEIKVSWTLISSTLNEGWSRQFCECDNCHDTFIPNSGECSEPMQDGEQIDWYITVNPLDLPLRSGQFVIAVNNETDGIIDTLTYIAEGALSVNEVTPNANVTSYPNPANNEFVVNYKLNNVTTPTLNVYSIIGLKLRSFTLNPTNGTLTVPTLDLENGVYFYSIEEKGQRVFTQKFNIVH